jgi:phosphatidylserine/phosphatidylglycerophosphate/cardiolipin synthase-like enzyme
VGVAFRVDRHESSASESVELLDGGEQAYPRMLLAIARAQRDVHLEALVEVDGGRHQSGCREAGSGAAGRRTSPWHCGLQAMLR